MKDKTHRDLKTQLEEARKEIAYYKKLSKDAGDSRLRETEALSKLIEKFKETEEKLRKSEAKYRSLFEDAVEGIFQTTPDGKFISANPALAKLFSYDSPQEMMEQITDIDRQHYENPWDRRRYKNILEKEGIIKGYEVQLLDKMGDTVWVSINSRAVRNNEGAILYYEGTVEDITARKEAEDKLRESENVLNSLINAIDDTLLLIDTKGTILVANEIFAQRMGKRVEEIIGVTQYELFPPDVAALRKKKYEEVARTGKRCFFEDEREGNLFESLAYPVVDEDGYISKIAIFAKDITERKRIENALRESEEQFRSLAEKSIVGIYLIQDGVFKYVNEKFAEMLGYTIEEMLDTMGPKDIVFPEDLTMVEDNIHRRISGEIKSLHAEFRVITKSKEMRNVEIYSSHTTYKGKPSIIGTFLDITDRKQAEENLKHISIHDSLTGLYNRFLFEEELRRISTGRFDPIGIIMCDLDGLKLINDNLGHDVGDRQLIAAANLLKEQIRTSDIVARIGGDEFAVLLPDCSSEILHNICNRLRQAIMNRYIPGTKIPLMISIGFALSSAKDRPTEELLKEADINMYSEKNHNRQVFRKYFDSIILQSR